LKQVHQLHKTKRKLESALKKPTILNNKFYSEPSVFQPENLLRESRRQNNLPECDVPKICVLDPDGDLVRYLKRVGKTQKSSCWACYHSELYTYDLEGTEIGIIPCAVGASYAVLVAEQLFVSGCKLLISVTSAGIITDQPIPKQYALITEAIRDEGTSYHYLPPDKPARISDGLLKQLKKISGNKNAPYFEGKSWTTDAPYRETTSSIDSMKEKNITCVEMEAAALYVFAEYSGNDVICFAHLTNSMAQDEGDFEKGEEFGSLDTLQLIIKILNKFTQPDFKII
jgi:uridine phosphorylase